MQFITTTGKYQSPNTNGDVPRASWCTVEYGHRKNGIEPGPDGSKLTPRMSLRKKSVIVRSDTFNDSLLSFREVDSAKRSLKARLQWLSSTVACLGVLSVALAIIDIELNKRLQTWSKSVKDPTRLAELVVSSFLSLVSVLTFVLIQRMHSAELRLLVVKNIYHKSENLWTTELLPGCLVENVICLFHVPPMTIELGVPYKLQLLVFLRIYLLARYVKEHSRFTNNKGTAFFASVTKTEITSTFLVKAYFLKYPFTLIAIVYSLNVFLGGYFVYVVESSLSYMDTIWMLVVTMTTLGFGDVVPVSFLARAFVGFSSVLGIFLMALFISVVHETLQLRQQEKRIISTTESAESLLAKRNAAAACIQSAWRLHNYTNKNLQTLELGDWVKATRWRYLQHQMLSRQRRWRLARRACSTDEYWKKLFLAEDTAMMLTDVYRTVNKIDMHIPNPPFTGRSRSSSRKVSLSSTIKEETTGLRRNESDQELNNTKPHQFTSIPHCTNNHGNHRLERIKPREASDVISADVLERKIESFEHSLDDIFRKLKCELQGMKESMKALKNRSSPGSQGTTTGTLTHNMNDSTCHGFGNVEM